MARYRFLKTHNRLTFFAEVEIEARPTETFGVIWGNDDPSSRRWLGEAIEQGIGAAHRCHGRSGGATASFRVTDLRVSNVDTTAGTAMAAATVAAWMALGHDESEISFSFDGDWSAHLPCSN